MHGYSSGSTLLVNAEVDSMGGVIDGGVDIGTKTSPRRVAIEKAQAELRVEYDVREERRRELEFLEKGGNPLDFKFVNAASVSVHSTSLNGQNPDQIVISEAKGSFALTASPRGDSVESSGRLGITVAGEPNSADNFDGDHDLLSVYPSRGINPSVHASQLEWSQDAKEPQDPPKSYPKKGQAYRRRNRSRTNRDAARSSSTDVQSRAGHLSSLPSRHAVVSRATPSDNQLDAELESVCVVNSIADPSNGVVPEGKSEALSSKDFRNDLHDLSAKTDEARTTGEDDFGGEGKCEAAGRVECPPCSAVKKDEKDGSEQLDELKKLKQDEKVVPAEALANNVVNMATGLDFESSCTHTRVSADDNQIIDNDVCNLKDVDNNRAQKEYKLASEKSNTNDVGLMEEDSLKVNEEIDQVDGFTSTDKEEPHSFPAQSEVKPLSNKEETEPSSNSAMQLDALKESKSACSDQMDASKEPPTETNMPCPTLALEVVTNEVDQPKVVDKEHEDTILEEARMIEAKRKRIGQLSVGKLPKEFRRKSQWDFVLEEMAWLANDFAQERTWKITSAAQLGMRAAFASRLRLEEQNKFGKQKSVAKILVEAVMEFWRSAALLLEDVNVSPGFKSCKNETVAPRTSYEAEFVAGRISIHDKDLQREKNQANGLQGYAVRFLQYNTSASGLMKVESSGTPDRKSEVEMLETSWKDQFTEENLFYTVTPGVMEAYRKSIELHLEQFEKTGNNMQEEVDTSMYDAVAEFCSQENRYEEDEGENVYNLSGTFDGRRTLKAVPKKRKIMKSYVSGSYEMGGDLPYGHCVENRIGTSQFALMGKRTANSLNVGSIPTRRIRTASRQRVGPSYGGSAGFMSAPSRNDASSGDTNSFQDDQNSLHGGSNIPKGSEVDSVMDFEKQYTFVSADISEKPKKKKKTKHQGTTYDHKWHIDSNLQTDQKDHLKKRLDDRQFESNDRSGLFGQFAKKPKMMKQSLDNSIENATMSGSIASPVASQLSNMSNPSKLIKLIGGRDRGRKAKTPKIPTGPPGSGSPWSLFEDQALVVLVHDMGPNWELVSNAINSTLQFKCIFRKPQECKERHKALMDITAGDGADSADDSGSSQPYPSTLPGIPKGSAMQLFQRLQGPMEEESIKSHFEKIISIGMQLHQRRKKDDTQDMKQLAPVHGSHIAALSQAVPNNVSGVVLTPLDLCDTSASSSDFLMGGYQGSFSGSLAVSHQGAASSMLPSSGANSSMQGSPGMGIGGSLASPSAQLNGSVRDGRYAVHRPTISIDDQQRLQQYNQALSNRNIQQSNGTGPGGFPGTDHGVRMLRGGGGMGVMSGMNRSMPISRPGYQGIPSSSVHSGNVNPNTGMSSTKNMQPGSSPGEGNSLRVHGSLHVRGIGQNSEQRRQMMSPDMQMQVTQACSPAAPSFGGMSSAFPDQSGSPSVQQYATHHQQHQLPQQHRNVFSPHHSHLQGSPHPTPHDPQAYAVRLARERQLNQRMLQQRQHHHHQQFPASSALMSQVPTQNQLAMSSPLHNNTQVQSHSASQSVSLTPGAPSSPMTPATSQQQQKHQLPPHGVGRNSQGGANGMMTQIGKQRRQSQQLQQQYQQSGRHHLQQRHQSQPQQPKLMKGMGRGNVLIHQSLPADHSHPNGLSAIPGNQVTEKGEQAMHMMQGQSLYSGSGANTIKSSKPLLSTQPSNQSHSQQKQYSTSAPSASKLMQQMPSHPDSSRQSQVCAAPSSASKHGLSPSATPSLNHQVSQVQPQPPMKLVNPPNIQRAIQQNGLLTADPPTKLQSDQAQVDSQFTKTSNPTSGIPSSCVESTNVVPLASASSSAHWKASESLSDSVIKTSSTQIGPTGLPPLANSPGSESLPSGAHGLGQRQLSGSLPLQDHNVGAQWQLPFQKQSQQQQPVEHSPQRQPQQEIQAGQSSTLTREVNSRLE